MYKRENVYEDHLLQKLAESNSNESYLFRTGGECREKRYYYIDHTFIEGDRDFLGMNHYGIEYNKMSPDCFVEAFEGIKKAKKGNKDFMEMIVHNVEKRIQDHEDYLEEEISLILKEKFKSEHTPESEQARIKKEYFLSAPSMDDKEDLIINLRLEMQIRGLLAEKFALDNTPVEEQQAIIDEILSKASSKDKKKEIIYSLEVQNRGTKFQNEQEND